MSAKSSIRWKEQTEASPGYHLYEDCIESLCAVGSEEPPVYLRLDGVHLELETLDQAGASVTVEIPRAVARELGLIKA